MNSKFSSAEGRTSNFSRNVKLESLLKDINSDLWVSEKKVLEKYRSPQFPMVWVMGPMRSGTTLFMQWLANTGLVAYPTNLLSRFYQAPIIGAKIQLLLTDPRFNFRDELGDLLQQAGYTSENGKTKGALSPNEFWYFWRRFLAEPNRDVWTDDELRQSMDTQTLQSELAGMMDVFQKPFAAKGMLFNYNIPFLNSVLDNVIFVQIKRDIVSNVSSVLDARKRQLGDESRWYSFKIKEYESLKEREPVVQAAGQVICINRAVTDGIAGIPESRKLVVQYEEFCRNPAQTFQQICSKLGRNETPYDGAASFNVTRSDVDVNQAAIEAAIAELGV